MKLLDDNLSKDIQESSQDALIDLYEIDLTHLGGNVIRFVKGTLNRKVIRFKDNEYFPIDFESDGFEISTSGTLPRPKLKFQNVKSMLSSLVQEYDDLLGSKITKIRTYEKYLDNISDVSLLKITIDTGPLESGWYSLGTHTFSNSGELRFEILEGIGTTVESIKLLSIETGQSLEFRVENNTEHLFGNWSQLLVDSSWGDEFVWDDGEDWLEKNKIAVFSDQEGSKGIISFVESGEFEVFYKTPQNDIPDTNALISLEVINKIKNDNGSSHFPEEIYVIEQKTSQNRLFLEFELSSLLDYDGEYAPRRRIIKDHCAHTYRTYSDKTQSFVYTGVTCPWAVEGTTDSYYNEQNSSISINKPWLDKCSYKLSACQARFKFTPLPIMSFPGVNKI